MTANRFTVAARHKDGTAGVYRIQGAEFSTHEKCRAYAAWKLRQPRAVLCSVKVAA